MELADNPDLLASLEETLSGVPGRFGMALTTSDGEHWAHDAERVVPSASTIKVPILLAALAQVDVGRVRLDQQVHLPPERVGGSGPLSLLPSLTHLPLAEVLTLMIALSDNDATNAVIDLVGAASVGELLALVPTRHTRLQRRMMDFAAAARGLQNETCAADLVDVLVALRTGRLLPVELTATALDIMRTQQFTEGLPAYLRDDIGVASKTGEIEGLRADLALLERGERWVAVAVLATDLAADGVDRGTAVLPTFARLGELAAQLL